MKIRQLPDWVDEEFAFPVSATRVLEKAGNVEIEAPDHSDSETLATVLERSGESDFESKAEFLAAVRGNLKDEYVGRKHYDDRGTNLSEKEQDGGTRTSDKSF